MLSVQPSGQVPIGGVVTVIALQAQVAGQVDGHDQGGHGDGGGGDGGGGGG